MPCSPQVQPQHSYYHQRGLGVEGEEQHPEESKMKEKESLLTVGAFHLHATLAMFTKASTEAGFMFAHAFLLTHVLFLFTFLLFHASAPLPLNLLSDSALVLDLPNFPGLPGFFFMKSLVAPCTLGAPMSCASPGLPAVFMGSKAI